MDTSVALDLQLRTVIGKKVKTLRKQGFIPATVYGKGIEPLSVQVLDRAFQNVYRRVGRTALVELNILGHSKQAAFIQDIQRHPISRAIIHADFHVVNLLEKIHVEVPLVLVGKSIIVERGDAVFNQTLATVEVEALPAELPQHIDVDVSGLNSFDKTIYVKDLPVSSSYAFITPGDEPIVSLTATRAGVEAEEEAPAAVAEPELIREEREARTKEEE